MSSAQTGDKMKKETTPLIPNALAKFELLGSKMHGKHLLAFLDYDGTLTPIVARPELACMSSDMRDTVQDLASSDACTVAVVTGRSLAKITEFIRLDTLYYAGSHGFDIRGPHDSSLRHSVARNMRPTMASTVSDLSTALSHVKGAELEDNDIVVSVHYREVDASEVDDVESVVDTYIEACDNRLVKHHGKKVFELRPRVDWNKGHAVRWLVEHITKAIGCTVDDCFAFYIGDDVSDEDAFLAVASLPHSTSVLVAGTPRKTSAALQLSDPAEVRQFLERVTQQMRGVAGKARAGDARVAAPTPIAAPGVRSESDGGPASARCESRAMPVVLGAGGAGAGAGAGAQQGVGAS